MKYVTKAGIVMLAGASLALMGCTSTTPDSEGGTAPAGNGEIAVVLKTTSNQFWATMQDGAAAAGKDADVKVTIQSGTAEDSVDEQTTLLETLVGNDYSCFAVAPITGTNLNQPLVGLSSKNVPIVNLDSPIDADAAKAAGINIATFIASNNTDAGALAGKFMLEKLGGTGSVAVIGGISGDANSAARTGGFTTAVEAGGLTIVQEVAADWDREKALDAATAIIKANPSIGGFYAANDGMALGIVQAAQNEGRSDLIVIGTDGNKDALDSVQSGGLSATVSQYPYAVGTLGVDACRALIGGATVPAQVDAPIALVSADNVEKALSSYPQPFEEYDNPFLKLIK